MRIPINQETDLYRLAQLLKIAEHELGAALIGMYGDKAEIKGRIRAIKARMNQIEMEMRGK